MTDIFEELKIDDFLPQFLKNRDRCHVHAKPSHTRISKQTPKGDLTQGEDFMC